LIIASTGMMLVFRGQIIDFVEKDTYRIATPPTTQHRFSLQELLDKIHDNSQKSNPTGITLNSDPHAPIIISWGESNALFVNPYTGVVLGNGSRIRHWLENVEYWHSWLGMKGRWKPLGGGIKRACNVAFLFMILTGLYLWWPLREWSWHQVIGFWSAPFLVIISLTGIIMSYPWANNLLYKMTGNEPPEIQSHYHDDADDKGQRPNVSLEALFTRAQQQVSDWKTITLSVSPHPDAPAVFYIKENGVGHYSQLILNRVNARVIKWEPYSSQNTGHKLSDFMYYLHTGEAGGSIGQIIAFLAAGGVLLLVWTGLAKAWRRFFYTKESS